MIEPLERLGAPSTKNDMNSLKKHPFFNGIDFANLSKYNAIEII